MFFSSVLTKVILPSGGAVILSGAIPGILTTSTVDSRIGEQVSSSQSNHPIDFFGGDLKSKNGAWELDKVCFYYDKGSSKNKISLLGYSSGSGISKGNCNTLESSINENERKKGVLRVEIPVDNFQKGMQNNAVWRMGPAGQVLGCLEAGWWKNRGGWRARGNQKVVVGDSFNKQKSGCTNSTFKKTDGDKDPKKCSGACKTAWQEISQKNSTGWDANWTSNYDSEINNKNNYWEIDPTKVIWKLEQ